MLLFKEEGETEEMTDLQMYLGVAMCLGVIWLLSWLLMKFVKDREE